MVVICYTVMLNVNTNIFLQIKLMFPLVLPMPVILCGMGEPDRVACYIMASF
jgi:hypothetical protein